MNLEDELTTAIGERDDVQGQLAEAQARLRKANCEYGDGWLSDDLECGRDAEPWCGKHAVLYYIKAHKEARGKLAAVERWVNLNLGPHTRKALARILKGE